MISERLCRHTIALASLASLAILLIGPIPPALANPWATLDRGHRILIERGIQLEALVLDPGGFDLAQWQNTNYTTINMAAAGGTSSQLGPGSGVPWGRWTENTDGFGPGDYLTPGEQQFERSFASLQVGDEQDISNPATVTALATLMAAQRATYNDTLLFTNQFGQQFSSSTVQNFMSQALPDMVSMDSYEFKGNVDGGSPTLLYTNLEKYRDLGLAGNDGTGSTPIPQAVYTQTFWGIADWDRPVSTSEANLNQFAALAFGNTMTHAFIYDVPATGSFIPMIFNGAGDQNPNQPFFDQVATMNAQSRNLGPALTRLITTHTFMELGQHEGFFGIDFDNTQPVGVPDWSAGADPGYLDAVVADNLNPVVNADLAGDVIINYFKPLDESFDGIAATNEQYFMVVNGLSDKNHSPDTTQQSIRLEFDFSGVTDLFSNPLNSLQRLNKDTGIVETVNLTPLGADRYQIDLVLDGGEGDLFKYNTGAPFVGTLFHSFDGVAGDYNDPTNWRSGDGPVPWGYDVTSHVANGGTAQISASIPRVNKLFVGTLGSSGTVNHTAGDVRIDTGGRNAGDENWFFIGQGNSTGTYNQSGGSVTAHRVGLGQNESGYGTYHLSGDAVLHASNALSDLNNPTPFIQIGQGHNSATGIMTVTGNANVTSDGQLDIGSLGLGALTLDGTGAAVSGASVSVGRESGSDGYLIIHNGTFTAINELAIGRDGSAQGSVQQTGGMVLAGWVRIGGYDDAADTAATGSYNMSGGSLTTTNEIQVGGYGNGSFIQDGGTLSSQDGFIGSQLGSNGDVTVNGLGAVWTNTDSLYVGGHVSSAGGTGTLTVTNGGQVNVTNVLKVWHAGTVQGDSGISATTLINGGTVAPGTSTGTLTLTSNYEQVSGGTLAIEFASAIDFDILNVTGGVTLGGTLDLSLLGGFTPGLGDTFQIITASSRVGEFSSVLGADLGGGLALDVIYGTNDVTLEVISTALVGDLNGDGFVGVDDLNIVLIHWNQNVTPGDLLLGDPTGEGFIGVDDLNIVLVNWNVGTPPSHSGANIPEPMTMGLLGISMVGLISRHRLA